MLFRTDLEEWSLSWTPSLGGVSFAIGEPGENPIAGVRISPPLTDPHLFIRERRTWWAECYFIKIFSISTHPLARINAGQQDHPHRTAPRAREVDYLRLRGRSQSRRPRVP